MLIGLNGRLKSGKDTTFQMISDIQRDRNDALPKRISFADPLKQSAAAAIGIDVQTLEELKAREDLYYILIYNQDEYRFNVRQYLQWYGTEAHRNVFGEDFWIDQALPLDFDHSDGLYVVTDMRFENEVQRVKKLGGIAVKVIREVETSHGNHVSEQNIDMYIDYFLDNTGTLKELRGNVAAMLFNLALSEAETLGPLAQMHVAKFRESYLGEKC